MLGLDVDWAVLGIALDEKSIILRRIRKYSIGVSHSYHSWACRLSHLRTNRCHLDLVLIGMYRVRSFPFQIMLSVFKRLLEVKYILLLNLR